MRRLLHIIILCTLCATAHAQYVFNGTSLSEALIALDKSTKYYDISFVYDELEDFTVTKTVKRGRSLPEAVREVCGFYPVRVTVKGRDVLVECIQKDRKKLSGRLVGPDHQPIAYANITLCLPSDTIYIGGGVSNEAGDFVIPCGAERAKVRISYVGFKTIERVMPIGDVGTISMQIENNYIGNIIVNGRTPLIKNKADRLLYIVSNDVYAKGLNAHELLSRVPTITMTGGQVMILGKGPAHFMLNGHITDMGDEAILQKLWTMQSEDIERIEVISNPSGRDMMEMGGSYINIVLRRDQALGWRGDFSTEAGISDDWRGRAGGSISYASEKFDMTIDAQGRYTTQTTDELTTYQVKKNESYLSNTHAKQTDKDLAANLTLRYQPAKQLEIGGMLSWQTQWPKTKINGVFSFPTYNSNSEAEQSPNNNTIAKSLTVYCDWRLDSESKLLSLTYQNYKKDDDGKSYAGADNQNSTSTGTYGWQNYNSNVDYHIQSARMDLTLPFDFVTIDAGASYTHIRNQAEIEKHDAFIYTYTQDHHESRKLDYQEKTKAAYLSFQHDWDLLTVKAGLRFEHIGWEDDSRDYWLPSASLSFKPLEGHQINLSWGTSTLRPNFYDLNPFRIYKTGYEYSEGNPTLKPSRMSNIELSYQNHKGMYVCAYHYHGSNVVMQQTYVSSYRIQNKLLAETLPYNLGRINQTGLYLRYQQYLSEHLMATAEGDGYYHDAQTNDMIDFNGWGGRLAASADWYLNRWHTILLNARYQHWLADYHNMTKIDGYGYFTFALRYAMLDDCLKLSLVINDPFHQHVTDETIYNSKILASNMIPYLNPSNTAVIMNQWRHTNHHSHYIGLTATYSFGGKKVRYVRHDLRDTESKRAEKQ